MNDQFEGLTVWRRRSSGRRSHQMRENSGNATVTWYRMLRLDGHPILQGHGSSQEIEQSSSSSNQIEFAVRVVRAQHSRGREYPFHKVDLQEQEFSIYRATDGKRLFLTSTPGVSLVEQSFALSPSGRQLAILTNANISFYSIRGSVQ